MESAWFGSLDRYVSDLCLLINLLEIYNNSWIITSPVLVDTTIRDSFAFQLNSNSVQYCEENWINKIFRKLADIRFFFCFCLRNSKWPFYCVFQMKASEALATFDFSSINIGNRYNIWITSPPFVDSVPIHISTTKCVATEWHGSACEYDIFAFVHQRTYA